MTKDYIHIVMSKNGGFVGAFTQKRLVQLYIKQHPDCYSMLVKINDMSLWRMVENYEN